MVFVADTVPWKHTPIETVYNRLNTSSKYNPDAYVLDRNSKSVTGFLEEGTSLYTVYWYT